MKSVFLLLTVSFILAKATSAQAETVFPKGFKPSDSCKSFIESIQNKYDYGWVQSKAIPSDSNSEDIFVFYYYVKTSLVNGQLKNPIAYFNGGPGFDSHGQSQMVEVARITSQIKTELNFVYIDQRGTGCSSGYPKGSSEKVLQELLNFGSKGIVHDAELIRQKLIGSRQWKIFGQSFGAYIVYRYLNEAPASVSKAYAHGNAIGISDADRSYFRILSQYKVLEAYLKVYPEDRKRFFAFKMALSDSKKCVSNQIRDYCGFEMMTHLVYGLGYKGNWENMHQWMQVLVPTTALSEEGLQAYVSQYITSANFYYRTTSKPQDIHETINLSLNFFGLFDWSSRPFAASVCRTIYDRIQKKFAITEDKLLLDECKAPLQFGFEDQIEPFILQQMPNLAPDFLTPEQVLKQIVKHKISMFAYSGGLDCYVPQEAFAVQNKIFGTKVKYTHFAGSGHDGYLHERQIFVDLTK